MHEFENMMNWTFFLVYYIILDKVKSFFLLNLHTLHIFRVLYCKLIDMKKKKTWQWWSEPKAVEQSLSPRPSPIVPLNVFLQVNKVIVSKKTSSKCWNEKVKETVKKIDICDKKGILLCWRPVARPSSVTAINNEDGGKLSQSCNQVLTAFSFFDR